MKNIRTQKDSTKLWVEDGTDDATIKILKAAPACIFSEWIYTGNSPQGTNSGNYEDLEGWLRATGLDIREDEDDLSMLMSELERETGLATLTHRGRRLRYHVQKRSGDARHDNFGYTVVREYRLISCAPARGGARDGSGKPPTTPGAAIEAALDRL